MDVLALNDAIELIKHYDGAVRPAFGVVGNVLAWRMNSQNAAHFSKLDGM